MTARDGGELSAALAVAIGLADDAIIGADAAQRVVYFNAGAERIFGYAADEILGRPLEVLVPGHRARAHHALVQGFGASSMHSRAMAGRRPIHARRKDGTEFPAEAAISHFGEGSGKVYTAILRDLTERNRWQMLLDGLVEGTSRAIGEDFLWTLVRHLARTLQVRYALIGVPVPGQPDRVRTLAAWDGSRAADNFEYELRGSASERVMAGESASYAAGVRDRFPRDRRLAELGAESYLCIPLRDTEGQTIGFLAIMDTVPIERPAEASAILNVFGARVASELVRLNIEAEHCEQAETLRRTSEELSGILASSPVAIYTCGVTGEVLRWNAAAARLFGWAPEEVIGRPLPMVPPEQLDAHVALLGRVLAGETLTGLETPFRARDGRAVEVDLSIAPLQDAKGRIRGTLHVASDVTAQRDLERRLQQSQKLEAIGKLAGGIAHDFNNILTVILGCTELLLERLPVRDALRSDAQEIHASAKRAADLTRQLLAFSHRQVLRPAVIDLNWVVTDVDQMLRRLIGEDIVLLTRLAPNLGAVRVDRSQLEQVLLNLAVNARDAMPDGGRLTIETENVDFDDDYCAAHPPTTPGAYVRLAVTDSGQGMSPETQRHLFEPFYTTKPMGKGTGLGLSVVYGVVKQSGGYIWVYSEPGRGTSFKIYLPRVTEVIPEAPSAERADLSLTGSETILLVEDDRAVRAVARRILEEAGYTVLAAMDGTSALELVAAFGTAARADLLITDVIMPGMTGPQLAERVRLVWAGIRLLYVSGYPEQAMQHQEPLTSREEYLQKPFTPEQLLLKVREVLDLE